MTGVASSSSSDLPIGSAGGLVHLQNGCPAPNVRTSWRAGYFFPWNSTVKCRRPLRLCMPCKGFPSGQRKIQCRNLAVLIYAVNLNHRFGGCSKALGPGADRRGGLLLGEKQACA